MKPRKLKLVLYEMLEFFFMQFIERIFCYRFTFNSREDDINSVTIKHCMELNMEKEINIFGVICNTLF